MSAPTVVLLHGLARSARSMAGLARHLRRAGYETWSRSYPSRRVGIADAARRNRLDPVAGPGAPHGRSLVRAGLLTTVSNPYSLLWWATIGAAYFVRFSRFGVAAVLGLFFRMYLEPATKVGPAMPEVLYDRVMKFSPRKRAH